MSQFERIRESVAPELERVEHVIKQTLTCDNPLMNQVIYSYMSHRGKQIRPILLLLTAKMFHGDMDKAINSAGAVELLHNASLIHDDVVDESSSRRGSITLNTEYDPHVAVIVGDYFTSNALNLSLEDGDIRVPVSLGNLGKALTLGEMDQIETAMRHSLSEDDYMTVISHKTAALFVACAEMGCYTSRYAFEPELQAMREFAELFGRAFQIKDDIFDYYESGAIGKPTGQDLQEGKITLPLLHVLTQELPQTGEMLELAKKPHKSRQEIERLVSFAKENGGIDYAMEVMKKLRDQAAQAVKSLKDIEPILDLFDYIIERDF